MAGRDLIGYGPNPPVVEWPNGARIAVSFVVNYEEGSENSILDGDPHGETVGESPSPVARGERDLANESFFEYGSRVGVWRILDLLDEYGVDSTFFACALALERNPEVGPEVVRRGHEVMGHGNRWEEYYRMDRDAEREAINQAVASITRTTGQRPLGWYTRYGPSVNTRELVVEEGRPWPPSITLRSTATRGWWCPTRWRSTTTGFGAASCQRPTTSSSRLAIVSTLFAGREQPTPR